ncbi:hypothetical protein [Massilia phyllosphaerae]|uniref:hypothetical protein n=1 Tax=Massilia phyllosphaerae TaxID=3106034 RepID=UPI002B1CBE8C|nr:hypothetical protein [Massilia sp. SGZ-792]
MEKALAIELIKHALDLSAQLNFIIEKVETIADEDERIGMREYMGKLLAASDEHLYRPILKQYPELDPVRT